MRRTAGLLVLLLAGCDLGPTLIATPPPAAERFASAPANAPAEWPDRGWWRAFNNAELDQLIAAAQANNRDLRAAAFRIVQAEAAARAASAPMFPTLSSNLGIRRARTVGTTTDDAPTRTQTFNTFSATLAATYEVDIWRRVRNAAAAGDQRVLSSRYDLDAAALSITAQVAAAYMNLLGIRDRLQLAQSTLAIARRIQQIILDQARAGGASDLEISQQQAAVAQQQANVADLTGQERQAVDALAVLVGTRPDLMAVSARSLSQVALPAVPAGIPSELLRRRPDIVKAESDLSAAGFDARVARAQRFPQLSLTADGGLQSRDFTDWITPERAAWSIGSALVAPIFQGGRLQAAEQQAVARMQELNETYAQTILTAFQDVEDTLAGTVASAETFGLRQAAYAAALRAYQISEERWRAGGDFLSVLQAQQTAFSTAEQLVQSNLTRYTAVVGVYRALGGGWTASP